MRFFRLYSVRLGTLLAAAVLLVGALLLALCWYLSSAAVEDLAIRQFAEVSRREARAAHDHLAAAAPALDTLDAMMSGDLAGAPPERLAHVFVAVLRANPSFSWVSYSDAQGGFIGANRTPGGKLRENRSTIADGNTETTVRELEPDGAWRVVRHDIKTAGYDPRVRPFYRLAARAGHRVWTRPYVFYNQGIPGITCALPHYGPGHALLGVFTIDFDLDSLSAFTRQAHLSARGEVFLTTLRGTLLAHPSLSLVEKSGHGGAGRLLTLADVSDPHLRAFRAAMPSLPADVGTAVDVHDFSFRDGGERYLASVTTFPVDAGLSWVVGALAPERDFVAGMHRSMAIWFALMALGLILVVAVGTPRIAGRFADPLVRVGAEMERVGRLDLADAPLPRSNIWEISNMISALANMKSGLRSFARYVPRDLVRQLLASGREAALGGDTRELTIFFSDLEGFTAIAETMSPQQLVEVLGAYLDEMTRVIQAHGGTVDKFLGDGVMAFWGAPEQDADHAAHAAEAALQCLSRLDALTAEGRFGDVALRTRIGLATGPVLVGNIGTPERMNYTVMGDVANLASRLEGLNKTYDSKVLVSQETAKRLDAAILARPVDVVAVKGKEEPVKVYELMPRSETARGEEICRLSSDALASYLGGDFEAAARRWADVLAAHPGDGPAQVMRVRAEAFRDNPPPATWSGVYVAKEK